ncbi:HipA family kinase [Runella sp. SP2]|uniref:HipA family kinase n=1 Tax=Runella sp. SP2 TaxID=2268026 RepID=UPI000F08EF58|nr:HipA family kinase [Runella sp. SP2]AYQ34850.1 hypothetical protein DTQ70_22920 [Runella sp. SP2]
MRITDDAYRLPTLKALRFNKILETGANKPGIINARDLSIRQSYDSVVKFRGAERMSPEACARELLAAFIAKHMGIRVVEPVLVEIVHDFVETERGQPHFQTLSKSIGLNYGSIYLPNYDTIPVFQPLNDYELTHAQKVVLFDLFIQNCDRRHEKPNIMSNGQELVIYDHELAFSFVHDIFRNKRPFELREADKSWIDSLFLLPKIKKLPIPEAYFIEALESLDNIFWDKAFELIPQEWQTQQLQEIRTYLTEIVNNASLFTQSIKTLFI